jgi:hypothetical protein
VLDPVDDVVILVMCHHPPDWFIDQDAAEDAICGRAQIHLFGHKHRQRMTRDPSYIRFHAGAVNPDRNEVGWHPGYNLIRLEVTGAGPDRALDIEACLLEWQIAPERYRPIMIAQGEEVVRHCIAIPGHAPAHAVVPAVEPDEAVAPAAEAETDPGADEEATMSDYSTRNLVFRFWNLTVSQRREIALRLGLIEEDELRLPEPERYGRALLRASERSLLDALAREVAQLETR